MAEVLLVNFHTVKFVITMSKKEISTELYEAIMEQSLVSAKIAAILEKEEDFWKELDKEIDQFLSSEKLRIKWKCNYHSYRLGKEMLKDCGLVYKLEKQRLLENWKYLPLQMGFYDSIVRPLEHIVGAERRFLDTRYAVTAREINRQIHK